MSAVPAVSIAMCCLSGKQVSLLKQSEFIYVNKSITKMYHIRYNGTMALSDCHIHNNINMIFKWSSKDLQRLSQVKLLLFGALQSSHDIPWYYYGVWPQNYGNTMLKKKNKNWIIFLQGSIHVENSNNKGWWVIFLYCYIVIKGW